MGLPARFAFGNTFSDRPDDWIRRSVLCLLGIFAFHGFHLTGLAIHGSTIASATAGVGRHILVIVAG